MYEIGSGNNADRIFHTQHFIDCRFTFRTRSPAATCSGRMVLIPVTSQLDNGNYSVEWKIWILSTSLENLDLQHEDEALLHCPARPFEHGDFDTDVFIIGGGNA